MVFEGIVPPSKCKPQRDEKQSQEKSREEPSRMPVIKCTICPSLGRILCIAWYSKWIFLSNHECSRCYFFHSVSSFTLANIVWKCRERKNKFGCSFSHSFQRFFVRSIWWQRRRFSSDIFNALGPVCFHFKANETYEALHIWIYATQTHTLGPSISHICHRQPLDFYWWKVIKIHNICGSHINAEAITWRKKQQIASNQQQSQRREIQKTLKLKSPITKIIIININMQHKCVMKSPSRNI